MSAYSASRMIKFLLLLTLLFGRSAAQTFSGAGGIIPDDGNAIVYTINVPVLSPSVINSSFGLESVCININHTWDEDLVIVLIAPDGTILTLAANNGGSGHNYTGTCFVDTATNSIINGTAPFNGDYRPVDDMGIINNGQSAIGNWSLYILDTYAYADAGTLLNWSITFGDNPAQPFPFTDSDLPLFIINTNGQYIPDDPRILVDFSVIDNGIGFRNAPSDPAAWSGHAMIELRGSSSQSFPKKSFGFETTGPDSIPLDIGLLGLPPEHDWILNANYTDKTLMRNVMAYDLWRSTGKWASRCRYGELFLNGQYQGVYILMEKIKRGNDRLDIARLDPDENAGDNLTGGYILKIDKLTGGGTGWNSPWPPPQSGSGQTIFIQYEYPSADSISAQQVYYIQEFVDSFETALAGPNFADPQLGYRKYMNEASLIDYFLLNEISKNIDGYRLSTFFYKDKRSNSAVLRMGPPWDYDLAWRNADYYGGDDPAGWAYESVSAGDGFQTPFWWDKLMQDPLFTEHLRCRWETLRAGIYLESSLYSYIDSLAALLNESMGRNFERWPILGVYVWPNPSPIPSDYAGEISNLKAWLHNRISWLDNNIPGNCTVAMDETERALLHPVAFPNPCENQLRLIWDASQLSIRKVYILSIDGKRCVEQIVDDNAPVGKMLIDLSSMLPGVYMIHFESEQWIEPLRVIKM